MVDRFDHLWYVVIILCAVLILLVAVIGKTEQPTVLPHQINEYNVSIDTNMRFRIDTIFNVGSEIVMFRIYTIPEKLERFTELLDRISPELYNLDTIIKDVLGYKGEILDSENLSIIETDKVIKDKSVIMYVWDTEVR